MLLSTSVSVDLIMTSLRLPTYRVSKNSLKVTYALFGLIFASLSASLIILSTQPLPRVVVQKQIRHTLGSTVDPLQNDVHPNVKIENIISERRLVRGGTRDLSEPPHRRLATETASSFTSSPISEPNESSIVDKGHSLYDSASSGRNHRKLDDEGIDHSVATRIIPAVLVAVAASTIICALFICGFDVYSRYHRRKALAGEQQHHEGQFDDDNSSCKSRVRGREEGGSMTSASSASNSENGGYWVQGYGPHPPSMLPPMDDQRDDVEGGHDNADSLSISQVSTLTETVDEGGYYGYSDIDEILHNQALETSSHVTPLSADHRVTCDTTLSTFVSTENKKVEKVESDCSSLTNGSATDSEDLAGEDCLEEEAEEEVTKTITAKDTPSSKASLEFSQDNSTGDDALVAKEERDANGETKDQDGVERVGPENGLTPMELIQLEQLIAPVSKEVTNSCSPICMNKAPDRVLRDIYFVPVCKGSKGTIGLQVEDALSSFAHPEVSKVELNSTFVGRIFAGDLIMSVNDIDTKGMHCSHVLNLMEGNDTGCEEGSQHEVEEMAKMVKMTVLSSETDGASLSEDDGLRSLDLGVPDTCAEL